LSLCLFVFIQDTNAQVIRALTAALGVSAKRDLDMNSLCVPRKAKEVRIDGGPDCLTLLMLHPMQHQHVYTTT
jgi:hypothetical protein